MNRSTRRTFLQQTAATAAVSMGAGRLALAGGIEPEATLVLKKSLKYGMVSIEAPMVEKFKLVRRLGFDGIELQSPNSFDLDEVLRARDEAGLPIHGVVQTNQWSVRLSDPDPAVRERSRLDLETAIKDVKSYGGSSVLLVPGQVTDPKKENQQQVWDRSSDQIRKVLPLAAELGIRILVENVWNGFCYKHDGPDNQTADLLAEYIDYLNSPWVGIYFDIGNHCKYGVVEDWITTLGRRIVKLDVKDWARKGGWAKIGDGDVNWPGVKKALVQIEFTGWCTAEVSGGGEDRLREIKRRMDQML